ncbi:MAG: hypothetical protein CUN56_00180 [Phototrophicales bacterium]|nr:MAG: hypothetical protein CUN56_00180 [Phototrophicales bacterium]
MGKTQEAVTATKNFLELNFMNPPAGYNVPIAASNIVAGKIAPSPETTAGAQSPNWIIVYGLPVTIVNYVPGEIEIKPNIAVSLISFANDATSRAEAEKWINDAEELTAALLPFGLFPDEYKVISIKRDQDPFYWGIARTSYLNFSVEKYT